MAGNAVEKRDEAAETLRRHFLGWQCRIRQHAVRQAGGRPGNGMRPRVMSPEGSELGAAITVLIMKHDPAESIALFRHQVRRTHDPAQRYERALQFLSAEYFQHPDSFSGVITALFGPESALADSLADQGCCLLEFDQFNQRYLLPCAVARISRGEPDFEATFWHNALFNADLPGDATVLAFQPDWLAVTADPPAP